MKKILLFLLVTLMLSSVFSQSLLASDGLNIMLDGQKIELITPHAFRANRTMITTDSGLFEMIEAKVRFDESDGKVWIEGEYSSVELTINEPVAYIHRKYDFTGIPLVVEMDVAPFIENGKVYVPLRFALEGLDRIVDWDGLNRAVLITSGREQNIIPVETPVGYKEISLRDISGELAEWVEANNKERGIYFRVFNEKTYILICAGNKPTGGYSIQLNSVTMVAPGNVYLTAQVISPSPDMMVTQAITYPCMLIVIDDDKISQVNGTIDGESYNLPRTAVDFEVLNDKNMTSDSRLWDWIQKNSGLNGIAYTVIDENIYVYIGAGEKPTGGYSIDVVSVTQPQPDEAYVCAVLNTPAPDMMVTQAITYPYAVIRINKGTIENVRCEIKYAEKTITTAGVAILPEDIMDITLFSLMDEKIKTYASEEYAAIVEAFNNAKIDDSFYIEMITGNKLVINLKDGSAIQMTSYGSKTNIVAIKRRPDGEAQSWHLVCPEIANILLSTGL